MLSRVLGLAQVDFVEGRAEFTGAGGQYLPAAAFVCGARVSLTLVPFCFCLHEA